MFWIRPSTIEISALNATSAPPLSSWLKVVRSNAMNSWFAQKRDFSPAMAREVGGEQHHCRFIQLPFNLAMAEAFTEQNQSWQGEKLSLLEAAARAGVAVVGSASLYQARLMKDLPSFVAEKLGTGTHAESAIQFARSAPGLAVALVGMGRKTHVAENLAAAKKPITPAGKWLELFQKA